MELMEINHELEAASNQVTEEQIQQFIDQIDSHKRIFVYGTGRSGLMLKALAMRLMQMGYQSYVIGETTTPSVEKGDLLIVATASGETGSVVSAADSGKKQGVDVIVITGSHESSITKNHKPLIRIDAATKFAESEASIQPLGSLFEQMLLMIFDALILKISRRNADMNSAMATRHASIE
ncbi:MAG: 6-phospho-3-hexuloisomerase [Lachnospiraceae bacterium]|nr:6-phospho-3-hexuloisomerase [Lachnospiraceae bacterium]